MTSDRTATKVNTRVDAPSKIVARLLPMKWCLERENYYVVVTSVSGLFNPIRRLVDDRDSREIGEMNYR